MADREKQRKQRRERQAGRQRAYKASVELNDEERRFFPREMAEAMDALERLERSLVSLDPYLADKVRGLRKGMEQLAAQITRAKARASRKPKP